MAIEEPTERKPSSLKPASVSTKIQGGAPVADGLAVGIGNRAVVKCGGVGERRRHLQLIQRVVLEMGRALRPVAGRARVLDFGGMRL